VRFYHFRLRSDVRVPTKAEPEESLSEDEEGLLEAALVVQQHFKDIISTNLTIRLGRPLAKSKLSKSTPNVANIPAKCNKVSTTNMQLFYYHLTLISMPILKLIIFNQTILLM